MTIKESLKFVRNCIESGNGVAAINVLNDLIEAENERPTEEMLSKAKFMDRIKEDLKRHDQEMRKFEI